MIARNNNRATMIKKAPKSTFLRLFSFVEAGVIVVDFFCCLLINKELSNKNTNSKTIKLWFYSSFNDFILRCKAAKSKVIKGLIQLKKA